MVEAEVEGYALRAPSVLPPTPTLLFQVLPWMLREERRVSRVFGKTGIYLHFLTQA